MRNSSFADNYELFFGAATIGAHAYSTSPGFRQRDVKFLIELFSNWIEPGIGTYSISVKSTQISRFLSELLNEGFARKITRERTPHYRLTRVGLIELLSRMVGQHYTDKRDQFYFLYYFILSYRPKLAQMVKDEGSKFPFALRAELEVLLDEKALLYREIEHAQSEMDKLKARILDAENVTRLFAEGKKNAASLDELISITERDYPYELNSQKPLSELLEMLPEKMRAWEMQHGNKIRNEVIWKSSEKLLETYIDSLKELRTSCT